MSSYYQDSQKKVIQLLQADQNTGLSRQEVKKRLAKIGPNLLPTKKKPPIIFKFFDQFKNILIIILLFATGISLLVGEIIDALAIIAIVAINATIGFVQEVQAERTLESLKQKDILLALVLRENTIEKVPFTDIVPGDILILEEGAKIPADARVIESFSLRVDESILTGESLPVAKNPKPLPKKETALADRINMIYKDTKVTAGRGKAVVVATGKETEIGKIALFLGETKPGKTPLTKELEKVGHTLTIVITVIAAIVFLLNYLAKVPFVDSLLVSISLAVAAIPEGLPAIVTIVLSLGVKRLAEKKTIVKKLPAVETLGAVQIIASDKTGTLTQNKINVVKIILASGKKINVQGEGYNTEGMFFAEKRKVINPQKFTQLEAILRAGVIASNACFDNENNLIGDTTEGALLVAARRANLNIETARAAEPRLYEVPFSSERKMMSVVVKVNETGDHLLYAKGAPEVILERCSLSDTEKKKVLLNFQKMNEQGLRSLALSYRKISKEEVRRALEEEILEEKDFIFLGIVAMQDPLRPEVKEALEAARQAGIRTIMITGDHKKTAASIAIEAGIMQQGGKVLTEEDIITLSQNALAQEIKKGINVFARISPMGKLRIVEAIKSLPHIQVAVTGDGVNDAPALTASHIGIAMGQTGTDITREVADMVIIDDNYATIVTAIEEGRTIFTNLVKFIRYLISCNLSEIIVVSAGVIFGTPLPLLPIQILWINLITDGLPALALGVDPPEYDVMKKPPRDLSEGILHKKRWVYMFIEGSIMGVSVFLLFLFALNYFSYPIAQTLTFCTLAFSQLVHAFNNRSTRKSLFQVGILTNKPLLFAAIISILLQVLVVQTSLGNFVFKTESLNLYYWIIIASVSLIPFFVVELKKQLRFRILP